MGTTYDVEIGGQGYLVVPGSYRRGAEGPAAWRWLWQRDWRGGDGRRFREGGETGGPGDGGRWRQGYGVGIAEGLRLGSGVQSSFASGMDGFAAIRGYGASIYAAASGGAGFVYSAVVGGGLVWGLEYDTGEASCRSMGVHEGELFVGSGSSGKVFSFDGAVWGLAFEVAGAAAVGALCSYAVWDSGTSTTVQRLMVGVEYSSGEAKLFSWDGVAATELQGLRLPGCEAMGVYGGRLVVAASDRVNLYRGRLAVYDGTAAGGGEWSDGPELEGDYLAGLAVFDGLVYGGSGVSTLGRVYAYDGERLIEACNLRDRGVPAGGTLRGIGVSAGLLYVGYQHPTDGAALLVKLSAGLIGDGGLRVVAGGGRPELERVAEGWAMGPGSGAAGGVRSLGMYQGVLYFARDAAGAATIYATKTTYRASGQCELSEWRPEMEGPAALRRVVLEHDALTAGQSVAVYAGVDGAAYSLVGTSNTVGSVAWVGEFVVGAKARRLALRLNLAGAGGSTPVVRGIGVEWAPVGEVKRRWAFEARCEGVVALPLRLKDNSLEAKTGAELSAALWASRVARAVTFVDVDDVSRDAWFVGLSERLGGLDQSLGAQTRAACELVEG